VLPLTLLPLSLLQEDEQPGAQDLQMLQQLLGTLMGGSLPQGVGEGAAAQAANAQGGSNASGGAGSSSGFRVMRLPGGGFSATYSSSSGAPGSGVHAHTSASTSSSEPGPFPGMGLDDNPMFANPDDFMSQLLLAGARSARQGGGRGPGFQHYDPASGYTSWEPMGGGPGDMGLEALLSELMGPGLFGGGEGGMRYEDLVGLDPVHVTTPEEVLSSLPQSKFVEGRKPGDRWGRPAVC
jgi:hypothetical protein